MDQPNNDSSLVLLGKLWVSMDEWKLNQDWNNWREYLCFKYPPGLWLTHPGYRIPDREGEVDSFENWKLAGKPKPGLFNYGQLIKNEPSREFVDLIMKP